MALNTKLGDCVRGLRLLCGSALWHSRQRSAWCIAGSADYVAEAAAEPSQWEGFAWTDSGEPAAVDGNGDVAADGLTEATHLGSDAAAQGSEAAVHAATPVTAVDGSISLESCLAAFFASEAITWACPAELKVRKNTNHTAHVRQLFPSGRDQHLRLFKVRMSEMEMDGSGHACRCASCTDPITAPTNHQWHCSTCCSLELPRVMLACQAGLRNLQALSRPTEGLEALTPLMLVGARRKRRRRATSGQARRLHRRRRCGGCPSRKRPRRFGSFRAAVRPGV